MSCVPAADNWTERNAQPEGSVPLIDSLIAAVLKSNGDGLVMHVGERPYVLSPSGPVEPVRAPADGGRHERRPHRPALGRRPAHAAEVGAVEREILLEAARGPVPPGGRPRRRRHLDRVAASRSAWSRLRATGPADSASLPPRPPRLRRPAGPMPSPRPAHGADAPASRSSRRRHGTHRPPHGCDLAAAAAALGRRAARTAAADPAAPDADARETSQPGVVLPLAREPDPHATDRARPPRRRRGISASAGCCAPRPPAARRRST